MNEFIDFLREFKVYNLILMGIMFWFIIRGWRHEARREIKSLKDKIQITKEELQEQTRRTDKLYGMFIEVLKDRK